MSLQMMRPGQQAAGGTGSIHPDFFRWLSFLVDFARFGIVPPMGIVRAYLDAGDIADNFDADGMGNRNGAYDRWQIANGNNGSPDLTAEFAGDVIALMRVE